jgi:hypothetical protein
MAGESQETNSKKLQTLLEQNLARITELERQVEKIHTYIKWQRVFLVFKILIIVVPLVLGIIYLPPILQKMFAPYQELLGNVQELHSTS